MQTNFENEYPFLTTDDNLTKLTLKPLTTHEVGVHTKAKLKFKMSRSTDIEFAFTVVATILRCAVNSAGFTINSYALKYNIGVKNF